MTHLSPIAGTTSAFERIDPYVQESHFLFQHIRLRRLDEFRQVVGLAMGRERVLILVTLVEQPLLRIGWILRDVELLAAGFTLQTTGRVLLGKRPKIPGATQPDFEFGNNRNHRSLPGSTTWAYR